MRDFWLITLALAGFLSISLQRIYASVPLKELKTRARHGDKTSRLMMKAVGYGKTLDLFLWFLAGVFAAGFFVLISQDTPAWFAVGASALIIWMGFIWLPNTRVSRLSRFIASRLSPPIAKIVALFHPLVSRSVRFAQRYHTADLHTGLYDRQDLIKFIRQQKTQEDNRILAMELDIAEHVLRLSDKKVYEVMTHWRKVKTVAPNDSLGPVLMDELHASGHIVFPVYDKANDEVVGSLLLRDVLSKKTASVESLMTDKVYYLNEDFSLGEALQAVIKTHSHMFVVLNNEQNYTGVITNEDILNAAVGQTVLDEFDDYENKQAVSLHGQPVAQEPELESEIKNESPDVEKTEEADEPKEDSKE